MLAALCAPKWLGRGSLLDICTYAPGEIQEIWLRYSPPYLFPPLKRDIEESLMLAFSAEVGGGMRLRMEGMLLSAEELSS